jgi:hypothetical protein
MAAGDEDNFTRQQKDNGGKYIMVPGSGTIMVHTIEVTKAKAWKLYGCNGTDAQDIYIDRFYGTKTKLELICKPGSYFYVLNDSGAPIWIEAKYSVIS